MVEYALKLNVDEIDAICSGKKKVLVSDVPIEKSDDGKYFLMTDDGLVGAIQLGYQFDVDEFVISTASDICMKLKHFDGMYGYRVLSTELFDAPIRGSVDDVEGVVYKIQMRYSNFNFDICRVEKTEEQRIVAAAVLIPGIPDLHKEIYDEETVTNAAHYFMENYLQDDVHGIDVMHNDEIVPKAIRVLQSYILDSEKTFAVDIDVFDDAHPMKKIAEVTYPKGTWIMVAKIISDDLWEKIKKGDYTGWSIAGLARVRELRKLLSCVANVA